MTIETRKVRLVSVDGDEPEEFADLIGSEGSLGPAAVADGKRLTFMPANRGDWLTMSVKRETTTGDKVRIFTKLGNTFTFRLLKIPRQNELYEKQS